MDERVKIPRLKPRLHDVVETLWRRGGGALEEWTGIHSAVSVFTSNPHIFSSSQSPICAHF